MIHPRHQGKSISSILRQDALPPLKHRTKQHFPTRQSLTITVSPIINQEQPDKQLPNEYSVINDPSDSTQAVSEIAPPNPDPRVFSYSHTMRTKALTPMTSPSLKPILKLLPRLQEGRNRVKPVATTLPRNSASYGEFRGSLADLPILPLHCPRSHPHTIHNQKNGSLDVDHSSFLLLTPHGWRSGSFSNNSGPTTSDILPASAPSHGTSANSGIPKPKSNCTGSFAPSCCCRLYIVGVRNFVVRSTQNISRA
ncbi:hypothetical protein Hypma_013939 [Hypsizygus marmoreus]|uniref:Uncharacterized protein n=1 Tax=Hypsizygus marmoreus TaxID=39966 RepID=A0A369K5C8_HYPMA|nr:hypothetical protein Hypma_013939 [Hypsizygus marmoreus]